MTFCFDHHQLQKHDSARPETPKALHIKENSVSHVLLKFGIDSQWKQTIHLPKEDLRTLLSEWPFSVRGEGVRLR